MQEVMSKEYQRMTKADLVSISTTRRIKDVSDVMTKDDIIAKLLINDVAQNKMEPASLTVAELRSMVGSKNGWKKDDYIRKLTQITIPSITSRPISYNADEAPFQGIPAHMYGKIIEKLPRTEQLRAALTFEDPITIREVVRKQQVQKITCTEKPLVGASVGKTKTAVYHRKDYGSTFDTTVIPILHDWVFKHPNSQTIARQIMIENSMGVMLQIYIPKPATSQIRIIYADTKHMRFTFHIEQGQIISINISPLLGKEFQNLDTFSYSKKRYSAHSLQTLPHYSIAAMAEDMACIKWLRYINPPRTAEKSVLRIHNDLYKNIYHINTGNVSLPKLKDKFQREFSKVLNAMYM